MKDLEKELQFFNAQKEEFLKHHEGKFVLIKEAQLVAAFDSSQDAYEEGVRRFGNTPFLIKRVLKEEPTDSIPALNLGILVASV